jgi:hypothetical protein
LIGQFCVFEWPGSDNRSFESTDFTNRFPAGIKGAARQIQTTRRSVALLALAALGDSLDRDHRRLLLDSHLVTPSPCSRGSEKKV